VPGFDSKNLGRPEETMEFDHGRAEWITIGDLTIGRLTHEPGWRWSTHIQPLVGGEWCQSSHIGVTLSGRMHVLMADGREFEVGPLDVTHIPPGHDAWVVGDEPVTSIEWGGVRGWLTPLESLSERVLATILFTDIVDSTAMALRLGDGGWHELLAGHNARVREILARFRGREIKNTGDGFLAAFDGAARAVRCAAQLVSSAAADGLSIRAAVHSGDVEFVGDDVRGVTVHEAARVLGVAQPNQVLVSAVTRELAAASGMRFEDRGEHELKGLSGARRLFAFLGAS
jgi:class 3 adenylate cyclase